MRNWLFGEKMIQRMFNLEQRWTRKGIDILDWYFELAEKYCPPRKGNYGNRHHKCNCRSNRN